ncbi:MAG: Lrp/AsnC family transcriptional regulator [Halobacteriota archaeon]|nr:Lrp/AsnC family transcriptional regulator [Halobacteriota archaeon]
MSSKIDDLDLKVIKELQNDARQSFKDIAERLGVSEGTVYNRVNKLKELGVIKKFVPDIDFSKLGYDLTALIGIAVEGGHLPEKEKEIAEDPNVLAVYDTTGEYDVMVVVKFKDRVGLNDFIKRVLSLQYVKKTYTMLALNVIKETLSSSTFPTLE